MSNLDDITGIKNSTKHISSIGQLIGTVHRNKRLLLKSELLNGLGRKQKELVEWLYTIKPQDFNLERPFFGLEEPSDTSVFKVIKRTLPNLQGKQVPDVQYVPKQIYKAYIRMAKQLINDTSGRIVLSSGYRSPAFQVLALCYNLNRHEFNLEKTLSLVALPGYSEHGVINTCALDLQLSYENFLRPDRVKAYAASKEFDWLKKNAAEYGFKLSYPEHNSLGLPFEPWHWRYIGK